MKTLALALGLITTINQQTGEMTVQHELSPQFRHDVVTGEQHYIVQQPYDQRRGLFRKPFTKFRLPKPWKR